MQKSGLLSSDELQAAGQAVAGTEDARVAARRLVEQGYITAWQAGKLRQGQHALFLGKYKLLDRLEWGDQQQYYLAEHTQMKHRVALKTLGRRHAEDPASLKLFEDEGHLAASLRHPNIIHVVDFEFEKDYYFLVMEFVDGDDLQTIVERDGPLPGDVAAKFISQAAAGLAYAHDQGVVHERLEPSRLLSDKQGEIAIIELGAAKLRLFDGESPEPPSQFRAPTQQSGEADVAANIYSLGACLHFLLTGVAPSVSAENPAAALAGRSNVPARLGEICRRLMTSAAKLRYTSAKAAADDLKTWLASCPPSSPPPAHDARPVLKTRSDDSGKSRGFALDLGGPPALSGSHAAVSRAGDSQRGPNWLGIGGIAASVLVAVVLLAVWLWPSGDETSVAAKESKDGTSAGAKGKSERGSKPSDSASDRGKPQNGDPQGPPRDEFNIGEAFRQASGDGNPEPDAGTDPKPGEKPPKESEPKPKPGDPPEEKPEPKPQPKPPVKKPPEKPPTKPKEPPKPKNPFEGLVSTVELPYFSGPLAASPATESVSVGSVAGETFRVELLGGDAAAPGPAKFSLAPASDGWNLQLEGSKADPLQTIVVARLTRGDDGLAVQWLAEAAGNSEAGGLRNCVLKLSEGEFESRVALRNPAALEPLMIDFEKSRVVTQIDIEDLPDTENLRFEVTGLEGPFPKPEFEPAQAVPADKGLLWIHCGDKEKLLHFKLMTIVRRQVQLTVLPYYQPSAEIKPLALTRHGFANSFGRAASREIFLGNGAKQLRDAAKKAKGADKQALEARAGVVEQELAALKPVVANLRTLEQLCGALNKTGGIHYRLLFDADGETVVLASTPGAPVEAKPEKKK
jgi:serine/threonine protein kinase